MLEIEDLFIQYPFTREEIESVYKCVGKKRERTIEVIEQALREGISPLSVPGVIIGIFFKTPKS